MANCSRPESYKAVVAEELAKGVCYDSIFHGLYFNMSSDQFYDHSFEMGSCVHGKRFGVGTSKGCNNSGDFYFDNPQASPVPPLLCS